MKLVPTKAGYDLNGKKRKYQILIGSDVMGGYDTLKQAQSVLDMWASPRPNNTYTFSLVDTENNVTLKTVTSGKSGKKAAATS